MKKILFSILSLIVFPAYAKDETVIVSIKPLHSLVAAVMQGDAQAPLLLVDNRTSPHEFTLRPSQMRAMQHAAIIFYMGDSFETFLDRALVSLPSTVRRVPMDKVVGMKMLPVRLGDGWEPDADAHRHYESGFDLHLWMSIPNAQTMVMEIARQLAIVFPQNRERYFTNARNFAIRLDELDRNLDTRLSKLRKKPFIVFHDAYQYLEKNYELAGVGSIMLHAEQAPSAKHVSDIREKIRSKHVLCVFREPSFDAKIVDNLISGTFAKSGVLDPEGALLTPGPELYFQLMDGIATGLEQCLGN